MAYYPDPEEARSDLFLAGAVYLFGPLLLDALARFAGGLLAQPVVAAVYAAVAPLATTALVPVLLARYRGESLRDYGWGVDAPTGIRLGLLVAVPIAAAVGLSAVAATLLDPGALPVVRGTVPAALLGIGSIAALIANVSTWLGLLVLAVYATVKGRDAFRADVRSVAGGVTQIGRVLGIIAVVAVVLLLLTLGGTFPVGLVLLPAGVALAGVLLLRALRGRSTAIRAALLAPTILLALRPFDLFSLFTNAAAFVLGVWTAALMGAIGLFVAAQLEGRRTAMGAAAIAVVFALLVPVSLPAAVIG